MKLNTVTINNYRGLSNAEIPFDGKSAVLFGINGSGKSSILRGINLVFSSILGKVVQNRFRQDARIEPDDVKIGTSKCEIKLELTFMGHTCYYSRIMDKKTNKRLKRERNFESFTKYFDAIYDDNSSNDVNIPIFVNYGVNRLVVDIPMRIHRTHIFDPLYAYQNAIQSTVDFRTFFEWFRNREDYENEVKVTQDVDYVDKQLQAVREATTVMLDGFSGLSIKRNPLSMKIIKNGQMLSVKQLSDGEKCTLALIGDLARRIAMANPQLENPLYGEGIVLIDEIELHLHPTWQRRIVSTLKDIFPNVQFILSTHSPQVLGDIPMDMKVFDLESGKEGIEISEIKSLRGWDVNSILENNMNTSSQNLEIRGIINRAYDLIEQKQYNEARGIVDELESWTNGKNLDVLELRFLIQRGERKRDTHK